MLKFKVDHAQGIKEARTKLDDQIKEELEKKAKEQDTGEHVDASGVSHSNIVLTWLSELSIFAKVLRVRDLHDHPRKM